MRARDLAFAVLLTATGCDRMVNRLGRDPARGCELGLAEACIDAANAQGFTSPGQRRLGALRFLDRACERGIPAACTDAGAIYYNATSPPLRDRARAARLFSRACDGRVKEGCRNLGLYHQDERNDHPAARRAFARACELGDDEGCGLQGVLMCVDDGVSAHAAAVPLLNRGCGGGNGASCYNVGVAERDGVGGPQGPRRPADAVRHFLRACELGFSRGCSNAGVMYFLGAEGVALDRERGATLLRRACAEALPESCAGLGEELLGGTNIAANPAEADTLLERACRLGSVGGCRSLAAAALRGAVVGGEARAGVLLQRACALGHAPSCSGVGSAPSPGPVVRRRHHRDG